jgi:hypothetical protein
MIVGSSLLATALVLGPRDPGRDPSSITVVGHSYRVYFVLPGESKEGHQLEFGAHGDTFTAEGLILIEKGLGHDLTRHVLFHEVGHACYFEHLRLGNAPIAPSQDAYISEEEAMSSTSNEMWQVIRDNPDFVRWLQQ